MRKKSLKRQRFLNQRGKAFRVTHVLYSCIVAKVLTWKCVRLLRYCTSVRYIVIFYILIFQTNTRRASTSTRKIKISASMEERFNIKEETPACSKCFYIFSPQA
jgi:hypothetical protein